jgi:hypothetical protein
MVATEKRIIKIKKIKNNRKGKEKKKDEKRKEKGYCRHSLLFTLHSQEKLFWHTFP